MCLYPSSPRRKAIRRPPQLLRWNNFMAKTRIGRGRLESLWSPRFVFFLLGALAASGLGCTDSPKQGPSSTATAISPCETPQKKIELARKKIQCEDEKARGCVRVECEVIKSVGIIDMVYDLPDA